MFPWFLVASLAVWRLTHLFQAEDGPADVIARLREAPVVGRAMQCFYCLSLWVAMAPALLLGETWPQRALLWPALSGAAIFLEKAMSRAGLLPQLSYQEEPYPPVADEGPAEEDHVQLRG